LRKELENLALEQARLVVRMKRLTEEILGGEAASQKELEDLAIEQAILAVRMKRLTKEMLWQSKQAPP
jgi:hypothetical protein